MSAATSLLGRLAGVERIETQLDEQDRRSEERHRANVETLGEIKDQTEEIRIVASEHTDQLALIADREDQEAKRRGLRASWLQLAASASLPTMLGGVLYWLHVIPH